MKKTAVLFFFAMIPAVFAQQSQPAPPPAAPSDGSPIIRHTVQEIVLEVVVRDSKGKVVKNLKPGDLQVFENGAPQEIRSFRFIQGRDVVLKGKPTNGGTLSPTPANPLKAVNLICIVFANLDAFTKKYAVDAVKEFMQNQLQPDTWVGVFNLSSKLTVVHQFTTNRSEMLEAANKAFTTTNADFASLDTSILNATPLAEYVYSTPNGQPSQGFPVAAYQVIAGGQLNQQAVVGADVSGSLSADIQRGELAAQRREFGGVEGMRQTDQVLAMISQLGTLPGRKSVLFFSPGLSTNGDPDLFKKMVDKGIQADVTVYAIDVHGLSAEMDQSQSSSASLNQAAALSSTQSGPSAAAAVQKEKMREGDYVADAVRTTDTQATLRALAEGTGGFLVGSTNDLRKPFQRILEEVDTHYEVIYHPVSSQYDGRLRTIEVKSSRAGLNIESQKGYFGLPVLGSTSELNGYEMTGLAALSAKQPPHPFDFRAVTYQFRPSTASSQTEAIFEIPAAKLSVTPEPAQKRGRMHVSLVALVKDSSGQVVDKFSQDSPFEIPAESIEKAHASTITYTHPLALAPGHYTLETAVLDREGKIASTSSTAFDSPERKGVGLSSILLVQRMEPVKGSVEATNPLEFQASPAEGERVIPELSTNLNASATPYVYFVVYPDKSIADKPKIQAEFWLGGKMLGQQTADLPAPDATGAIPMVIKAANKPGECELRITALQGDTSSKQVLAYTIAAK